MKPEDFGALWGQYKEEIDSRSEEIDPSGEQDWYSMTLGWAIAKGLSAEKAHDFARVVRYGS